MRATVQSFWFSVFWWEFSSYV